MQQTPAHDLINKDLMALIPPSTRRIVDVGCMKGSLAKARRASHPDCEVIGIDIDPNYASEAAQWCSRAFAADIETMDDSEFGTLFPNDCWIFGDCLEHLRDPWSVLKKVRARIDADGCLLACIPNAQHWSVQWRLATGNFRYEDQGLLDRTHVRWFTRQTMFELFADTGWHPEQALSRTMHVSHDAAGLAGVRAFAAAVGADPELAVADAAPMQYVFKLVPKQ
jgi:trans-aconitate methyltransferase